MGRANTGGGGWDRGMLRQTCPAAVGSSSSAHTPPDEHTSVHGYHSSASPTPNTHRMHYTQTVVIE